ncbi:protein eva-1 homolog C [Gouania willdenowi]|uniref:Protein eva-1 homolog C-like n=1 Tax=Gouania willdenowi TaxID=441366 RepID=A0A8C5H8X1_GOUWI|nr:protein eva-1 homolog C-like [Gouania willdenowi]
MTVLLRYSCSFCLFFLLPLRMQTAHSAPDFSLYLDNILKNQTAHACEGDTLSIKCPSRMTVAVLSAFYGFHVHSQYVFVCPSASANTTMEEDAQCTSQAVIQKVMSKCQDRHSCHIPVFSQVFGQDSCPLTSSKYLLVSYKCRPEHHRTRLVCENERLRLVCKNDSVLAIFSASFGHLPHGGQRCHQDQGSHSTMACLSRVALRKVSRRCHGRPNCSVLADTHTFGDPCFPNTRKHLRVSFTCGVSEPVTLYFVSGICSGLVFLLCLFGFRSTVISDIKDVVCDLRDEIKASRRHSQELKQDFYNSDVSETSSFCGLTQSYRAEDILSPSVLVVETVDHEVERTRNLPNGLYGHAKSTV